MAQKANTAAAAKQAADSTEHRSKGRSSASGSTKSSPRKSSKSRSGGSSRGKTAGRYSSGKKNSSANRKKSSGKDGQGYAIFRESIFWLLILFSVLLSISNFGLGGSIGETVSSVFFGLMGWLSYLFPFAAFLEILFIIANEGNHKASHQILVKAIGGILLFLSLCLLASLIVNGNTLVDPLDAYASCSKAHNAGGMVGAFLSWGLIPAFGIFGSYAIDIIFIIISLVMLTGKSALRSLKHFFGGIMQGMREGYVDFTASREAYHESFNYEEDADPEDDIAGPMDHEAKARLALSKRKGKTASAVSGLKASDRKSAKDAQDKPTENSLQETDFLNETDSVSRLQQDNRQISLSDINPEFLTGRTESPLSTGKISPAAGMKEIYPDLQSSEEMHTDTAASEESAETETVARRKNKKQKVSLSDADKQHGIDDVQRTINAESAKEAEQDDRSFVYPTMELLDPGKADNGNHAFELHRTADKLTETLHNFGVDAKVTAYSRGPAVTRFEITPEIGVKVSKIVSLADDIKLNLAAADIRIEAPIPGKSAVGIEVPNAESATVPLRALLESKEFQESPSKVSFAVGRDIAGQVKIANIAKMPHLLIAGATGSGKSVCINTIIMSILYKAKPDEVKLIMIDPKVVELSVYNGIPHLLIPVVTDPKKAAGSLNWAVNEMTDRYQKFAESGVRDIRGYNERIDQIEVPEGQERPQKMPLIVIIVDELADLMMVASKDVEEAICRLAQLARAAGIHLIIATQRPSVNVITGLIKANMPSRIAFAVTSGVDSRTILDMNGAEKLLGKGDMLFDPQGAPKPLRIQGAFVSDDEVARVVKFIKENNDLAEHDPEMEKRISSVQAASSPAASAGETEDGRDSYFTEAGKIITDKEKASIGMLQRYLKVGFNRAARIMDQLEEAGVVGPEEGTKPRAVLMSPEQFKNYLEENG